jgi:amino acid transporter
VVKTYRRLNWSNALVWIVIVACVGEELLPYPAWALDTMRACALVVGASVIVMSLAISRRYWENFRNDPQRARLLPRHVVRVGLGVAVLTIAASAAVVAQIGGSFVWYVTPLTFPAVTITAVGLWDMIEWLPSRNVLPDGASRRHDDPPII